MIEFKEKGFNHYLQLPKGIEDYAIKHDMSVDEVILRACYLFLECEKETKNNLKEEEIDSKKELINKIKEVTECISDLDKRFKERHGVSLSTIGIASLLNSLEKK